MVDRDIDRLASGITAMFWRWRGKPDRAILFEPKVWAVSGWFSHVVLRLLQARWYDATAYYNDYLVAIAKPYDY